MKSDQRPVSIEDLLRLKRAERPAPEFWAEFDRQLRAKQLAALVERRRWWQRATEAFAGAARYPLPLGAAALLAVSFVSIRSIDFSSDADSIPVDPAAAPRAIETLALAETPAAPEAGVAAAAVLADTSPEPAAAQNETAVAAVDNPAPALASEATAPGELSRIVPLLGAAIAGGAAEISPAARHIAENLAVVQAAQPGLTRGLLGARVEPRGLVARPAVEPLQQITPPAAPRRSRILTAMVSMTAMSASEGITQRAASRIDDEALYERVRGRFGAERGGFNMRF